MSPRPLPSAQDVRDTLGRLAREQLGWTRPLPDGELASALDSMDRLALVVAIEDHFRIAFEPEDDEAATLDDVVAVILRRLAEAPEDPA